MTARRFALLITLDLWLFTCGIWPLANPEHGDGSFLMRVDYVVHAVGFVLLVTDVLRHGWRLLDEGTRP